MNIEEQRKLGFERAASCMRIAQRSKERAVKIAFESIALSTLALMRDFEIITEEEYLKKVMEDSGLLKNRKAPTEAATSDVDAHSNNSLKR